jgi:mannose-6-phosphate isomerase-like protein (cupin superfamily)
MRVTGSDEGRTFWVLSERARILLDAEHSGGAYTVIESEVLPGGGPPPHAHARESEMFFVIDGEFQFIRENTTFRATAGTAVYVPENVTHTFKNVGKRTGRLLVVANPCGMERMFAAAGVRADDPEMPPPQLTPAAIEKVMRAATAHDIVMKPDWRADREVRCPRKDVPLWVLGQHVNVKLSSDDTARAYCVAEVTMRPGEGVPPHAHRREDEIFYITEGTVMFRVAEEAIVATPGTMVYVPRMVQHAFANIGETNARIVDVHAPGGFERFFMEAGSFCTDPDQPPTEPVDLSRAVMLMQKHGMTVPGLVPAGV